MKIKAIVEYIINDFPEDKWNPENPIESWEDHTGGNNFIYCDEHETVDVVELQRKMSDISDREIEELRGLMDFYFDKSELIEAFDNNPEGWTRKQFLVAEQFLAERGIEV